MFASLKSMLSNHVAPGGSQVTFAPFSFAVFARPVVSTNVAPDTTKVAELARLLGQASLELDSDNHIAAKRFVAQALTLAESMQGGSDAL